MKLKLFMKLYTVVPGRARMPFLNNKHPLRPIHKIIKPPHTSIRQRQEGLKAWASVTFQQPGIKGSVTCPLRWSGFCPKCFCISKNGC